MEIIYPPLVEQGVAFFSHAPEQVELKAKVYEQFVKQGISNRDKQLNTNGNRSRMGY